MLCRLLNMREGLQIMNYVFVIILISMQLGLFMSFLLGSFRVRRPVTLYTGHLRFEYYTTCARFFFWTIVIGLAFMFFPGHAHSGCLNYSNGILRVNSVFQTDTFLFLWINLCFSSSLPFLPASCPSSLEWKTHPSKSESLHLSVKLFLDAKYCLFLSFFDITEAVMCGEGTWTLKLISPE